GGCSMSRRIAILLVASTAVLTAAVPTVLAQPQPAAEADELVQLNFPQEIEVKILVDYVSQRLKIKILYDDVKVSSTTTLDQSRTANAANEITDFTNTTGSAWTDPTHDAAGNMTLAPSPTDPGNSAKDQTYAWDAWNRLVQVLEGETTLATYEYDGLHRRIKKTVDGTNHHYYLSEQNQVLEEQTQTGMGAAEVLNEFVWHPYYVDALAARWDDSSESAVYYHPLHDGNFNVTMVIDGSANVQERYHYSPYGQATFLDSTFSNPATASAIGQEILYTGRQLDPETGLFFFRARYYHAIAERFVQRDALGYFDGMNLYHYVRSRPTGAVDPSGFGFIIPVCGSAGASASASVSQCVQKCAIDDGGPRPANKPCKIDKIRLACRKMPSDPSHKFFHCFLMATFNDTYQGAVSGIRDDDPTSATCGRTVSAERAGVADWDYNEIAGKNATGVKEPFGYYPFTADHGKFNDGLCGWWNCARQHANNDLSGVYGYNQYYDNSNTFITRVIRNCGGTADFPWRAWGADDISATPPPPLPGDPPVMF
ncbi:MAG: RHS repeat-associated core domain-containing protein, partial [Planctomycetaceae bacterium]